jgi:hypothetical protein
MSRESPIRDAAYHEANERISEATALRMLNAGVPPETEWPDCLRQAVDARPACLAAGLQLSR